MAKKRYQFNPQTLTYEVIAMPFKIRSYRFLRKLLIGFILASLANLLFSFFFYTPKMYRISKNNNELILKYGILRDKIQAATDKANVIHQRDNHVYRQLLGADSLSLHGIYTPYSEDKYIRMQEDIYAPLMIDTWLDIDATARLLYLQSKSLDELEILAADKELMAESIPAIWPINKKNLRNNIGHYGYRMHPILKYMRMHTGIDLGGKIGDPVYATGDGVVAYEQMGTTGYGKQIVIDHGFGYKTRYAHLNKIMAEPGQKIKRGELIAELGNTGLSSAPHLHYEVIYRGSTVDPLNYFSRDMTEAEFAKIIEAAKTAEGTIFEE